MFQFLYQNLLIANKRQPHMDLHAMDGQPIYPVVSGEWYCSERASPSSRKEQVSRNRPCYDLPIPHTDHCEDSLDRNSRSTDASGPDLDTEHRPSISSYLLPHHYPIS